MLTRRGMVGERFCRRKRGQRSSTGRRLPEAPTPRHDDAAAARSGERSALSAGRHPERRHAAVALKDGGKEFRLVAEPVQREFAPGMVVDCWGYNGQSPGPTIEVVEGDRVRLFVTNHLPERTSMHWHGVLLPNGMDGVAGLMQPHIEPGETYVYEFTLRQHGTLMYHPHSDEMVQMALGMMGLFVIHPRGGPTVDRDFGIMLHAGLSRPGTAPRTSEMTDFNMFTFNGRAWPGTAPLVARKATGCGSASGTSAWTATRSTCTAITSK